MMLYILLYPGISMTTMSEDELVDIPHHCYGSERQDIDIVLGSSWRKNVDIF